MSVQALSGDFLDRRDLSSVYDLQFDIPGLVVNNRGMFGAGLALRGVTDQGGGSLAIAPHVNGVYLGRSNAALARQFDVARIEVVKGPQGTLYGRNATGGSINVITRAPAEEFGAAVDGAFGSFNTARVEGHVNLPAEKVAARIAVAASEGDGFIRNSVDDRRFAEEDYGALRAALRARPTAALTIDVMAQRVEDDGASSELWLPRKEFLPDPNDIRLTTVTLDDPHLVATNDVAGVDLTYALDRLTLRSITRLRAQRHGRPRRLRRDSRICKAASARFVRFDTSSGARNCVWSRRRSTRFIGSSVPVLLRCRRDAAFPVQRPGHRTRADQRLHGGRRRHGVCRFRRCVARARRALARERRAAVEPRRASRRDLGYGTADNPRPRSGSGLVGRHVVAAGARVLPHERMLAYASVSTGYKSGGATTEPLPNGEFDCYDPEEVARL